MDHLSSNDMTRIRKVSLPISLLDGVVHKPSSTRDRALVPRSEAVQGAHTTCFLRKSKITFNKFLGNVNPMAILQNLHELASNHGVILE